MKLKLFAILFTALALFACGEGVKEKTELKEQNEKASYAIGLDVGKNFKSNMIELDYAAFLTGLKHAMATDSVKKLLTEEEIAEVLKKFQEELMAKQDKKRTEDGKKNKEEGDKFLAENAKKEGIKVTASGLQYRVIESGNGNTPKATDNVKVHYTGKLLNGTIFDSSVQRGEPAVFPVTGVIQGWQEVIQLMKEGDKWEVFIPSELAYGPTGAGQVIGANQVLIFEVNLISIEKSK